MILGWYVIYLSTQLNIYHSVVNIQIYYAYYYRLIIVLCFISGLLMASSNSTAIYFYLIHRSLLNYIQKVKHFGMLFLLVLFCILFVVNIFFFYILVEQLMTYLIFYRSCSIHQILLSL